MTTQSSSGRGAEDMSEKTVLITGATNGIGLVTAAELARMGAAVTMVGRNRERGEAALAEVRRRSGSDKVEIRYADLAWLEDVRRLAEGFLADHDRLHVLINNAGAINLERQETRDGFELTFGVNHLAHFYLTNLLLERLERSAPARIINVSSVAHLGGWINFDDLQGRFFFNGMFAYAQSKLANVLHAYELARRLAGTGVTANALHPGGIRSGFNMNNGPLATTLQTMMAPFLLTPEQGAETMIYLASSPEVDGVTGRYFDNKVAVPSSFVSYDPAAARRLWEVSEELVRSRVPSRA